MKCLKCRTNLDGKYQHTLKSGYALCDNCYCEEGPEYTPEDAVYDEEDAAAEAEFECEYNYEDEDED